MLFKIQLRTRKSDRRRRINTGSNDNVEWDVSTQKPTQKKFDKRNSVRGSVALITTVRRIEDNIAALNCDHNTVARVFPPGNIDIACQRRGRSIHGMYLHKFSTKRFILRFSLKSDPYSNHRDTFVLLTRRSADEELNYSLNYIFALLNRK